jgi:glutamate synthase (ferredoxin)
MSGGIAYVLDEDGGFAARCNREMVDLTTLEDAAEQSDVRLLLARHLHYTESPRARTVLFHWDEWRSRIVRVMPRDYARVLDSQRRMREAGLSSEDAEMAAFELNVRDVARAGGR